MFDRRIFLKAGALALFSLGPGPTFLTRAALAAAAPAAGRRRKVLVTVFLRGAMDGLAAVPPLGDPGLTRLRPRIALPSGRGESAALDLDGRHGLHPALAPLAPFFRDRQLAIIHGVGSPDPTRSHFDAQDFMESGTPGRKGTATGWLNRAVGRLGHDATPFRAVATSAALPRSLYGPEPALAIADLERFRLGGGAGRSFGELYAESSADLLRRSGADTFEALRQLSRVEIAGYRPAGGATYPRSPLGQALRQIAILIKAGVGLEVAFAESGGWDTHVGQGAAQGGFARSARDLADSLAAFWTDLGADPRNFQDDVTVLTMTEFGRTVAENGSGGTDHGHASCSFVLGETLAGGKVHGAVPALDRDALYEGRDLPVAVDFRALFAGVAGRRLGIENPAALFPGWSGKVLG